MELKPCPFCGMKFADVEKDDTFDICEYFIRCVCGARSSSSFNDITASILWNTRVGDK